MKNAKQFWHVRNSPWILMILKFLVVFIFLNLFLAWSVVSNAFINFFVILVKPFLSLFGEGVVSVISNSVIVNGLPLTIDKECTGITMYALFAAFVFAYPAKTKTKLKGVGFGLLALIVLNLLRLLVIIFAASFNRTALNFTHDLLWPSTFFIFVLIVGYFYVKRCSKLTES